MFQFGLAGLISATLAAAAFDTSVDPGGCLLEHIAAEPGINQYQYDSLSPAGDVIAVAWDKDEARGTYLLNLVTGERTDLPELNNGAVFAPDGRTLVNSIYTANGKTDIAEYDLETGALTVIAPHEDWDWLASYSSDGETILFNSYRTGASDIYTYRKSTEELKRWTVFEGYDAHAQFSPDDSKILFHRRMGEGNYDIFAIDAGTGGITQITSHEREESYGSWSPDGQTIAFASDRFQEPGVTDLFLMRADGTGIRRLTDFDKKDAYPFFSPDGKYLYFNSLRGSHGIFRMRLDEEMNCVKG